MFFYLLVKYVKEIKYILKDLINWILKFLKVRNKVIKYFNEIFRKKKNIKRGLYLKEIFYLITVYFN